MNMQDIAPPRDSKFLGQKSKVIHNSGRYVACIIRPGLTVQSHQHGTGKLLPVDHPQYADYVECIETALDEKEADAICSALLR